MVVYLIPRGCTVDATNLNRASATCKPCFPHFDEKIQDSVTQSCAVTTKLFPRGDDGHGELSGDCGDTTPSQHAMPRKGKSKPVRFESRTARLAVDPAHVKFVRVMIPQTGAVKQYAESEQASRSGKWHISLKHRPNLQKGWVALKHLYILDGPRKNLPYETEAAAEKEVVLHMMTLEGFDRDGRAFYEPNAPQHSTTATSNTTDFAWGRGSVESAPRGSITAIDSTRSKRASTSTPTSATTAASAGASPASYASSSSSSPSPALPTSPAVTPTGGVWPVPRGRPFLPRTVGRIKRLRPQHSPAEAMDSNNSHLIQYLSAARRRGPAGKVRRTVMNHAYGGRQTAKRRLEKEQAAEAAEERSEKSRQFRNHHIKRLDAALLKGGEALSALLVWSERLAKLVVSLSALSRELCTLL